MGIQFNEIDDAVLLTQNLLIKRGAFIDMQTDLTDHVAVREIWEKKQRKFDGGLYWTFNAQIDHNHSARAVGLFEDDSSSFGDTMIQGKVDARHVNATTCTTSASRTSSAAGRRLSISSRLATWP